MYPIPVKPDESRNSWLDAILIVRKEPQVLLAASKA
jgi:hypothetical protein